MPGKRDETTYKCSFCGKTQEQVRKHVEQARTSIRAKLPQKKREADQQNEARWAAERQQGLLSKPGRNDHSL